jgi:hypothetical protein
MFKIERISLAECSADKIIKRGTCVGFSCSQRAVASRRGAEAPNDPIESVKHSRRAPTPCEAGHRFHRFNYFLVFVPSLV